MDRKGRLFIMNWYTKYKMAKALDPDAWSYEENPARLTRDRDSVPSPFGGRILQPQDQKKLEINYRGVHLTPSFNNAVIYANIKSTQEDPPVVIEIYGDDLKKELDVDAKFDYALDTYLDDKRKEWSELLKKEEDPSTIVEEIKEGIYRDKEGWEINSEDFLEQIVEEERPIPPSVVEDYLNGFLSDKYIIEEIKKIISGKIPNELRITSVQQFRVMKPIVDERVKAIYQVDRINFDQSYNIESLEEMDDEELQEEGIIRIADGKYTDEDGRKLLDYEDIYYSNWANQRPLYIDKQQRFSETSETVYHGTSLSRARSAFPILLR